MNSNICDNSNICPLDNSNNNNIIISPVSLSPNRKECIICLETNTDGLYHYSKFSNNCECNYYIHTKCLHNWIKSSKESLCIFCKKPMYYIMDVSDVSDNQQYIPNDSYIIQTNQTTIADMDYQQYPTYYPELSSFITNNPDITNNSDITSYLTRPYLVDTNIVLEQIDPPSYNCNILKSVFCISISVLMLFFSLLFIYSIIFN